ncbi:hypothetical protein F4774DRAFT_362969 [Daldinia eschscholtzii]|nr:hypothetical protein F4774DRAFT_362969 [Daldinia eschscholtzii]
MELAFPGKPPQWPDGGRQEVNASGKDVGADASPLGQGPGVSPTSPYLIRPIKSSTYLEERKDLIKRRVRLACLTCRKRKIRCDIATSQSSSCTNCSRTGRACEVHQDRQHGESLKETRASMGFLSECSPPLHPLSLPRIEQRRRSRRGSGVLQERDVNARSDTQSIGSRRSNKSFMSGISVGSMKSCFSRCSVRSSRSILSQRSRISIKSLESRKSSRSFQSLGTGASTGSR